MVAAVGADVVALQEVTPKTWPLWRESLGEHALWSLDACAHEGKRPLGVVLAARDPLERVPTPPGMPWPERVVAGVVTQKGRTPTRHVAAHSPISPSPNLAKVRWHEAMLAWLRELGGPAVLLGDLNTPRRELPDGSLLTFAHNSDGSLRPQRGERWDAAEQALIRTLGWTDAFRAIHPLPHKEISWAWPNGGGYRLDHVLVSLGVQVHACEYLHDVRVTKLSDHSALVAEIGV